MEPGPVGCIVGGPRRQGPLSSHGCPAVKRYLPAAVFLAVALASLVMAGFAYFATQEAARIKLGATVDDALNRIESRLTMHLALLNSVHALFKARDGDVGRVAFATFFDALQVGENFPGLRGIGYLRLAETGREEEVQRQIERDFGVALPLFPKTGESWRTPVVLFEPLDDSGRKVIGFDMFAEPGRRGAIAAAMRDDAPHATGLVRLGEMTGGPVHPGFLVFKRLDVGTSPATSSQPERRTAGFVFASFRAAELFATALGTSPLLPLSVEVYDGPTTEGSLIYRSRVPPDEGAGAGYVAVRSTTAAGRQWTIVFRPTSAFSAPTSRAVPLMLGLFGLLLAAAIAVAARLQDKAFAAVEALRLASEKSLVEKDLMLNEMKHRIKNSITRMLAIARQTAAGSADIDAFIAAFGARLQAMAASQDILTRSRWQKADLADLLRTELAQVFGRDLPDGMLSGTKVVLDEAATQALGLTFHELATNALKYGDIEMLRVSWDVVEEPGGARNLSLAWLERTETPAQAPAKTGFGTKLIDMNVERELGGSIVRDFGADGLRIDIVIPLRARRGRTVRSGTSAD